MHHLEQLRRQYHRQVEHHETQAAEWAARAARESDLRLRASYDIRARQEERAAEVARRRLVDLERRMAEVHGIRVP